MCKIVVIVISICDSDGHLVKCYKQTAAVNIINYFDGRTGLTTTCGSVRKSKSKIFVKNSYFSYPSAFNTSVKGNPSEVCHNISCGKTALCSSKSKIITLANVDRFSKFFRQVIRKKILYVYITSPAICCYTTLQKLKIQKCN